MLGGLEGVDAPRNHRHTLLLLLSNVHLLFVPGLSSFVFFNSADGSLTAFSAWEVSAWLAE